MSLVVVGGGKRRIFNFNFFNFVCGASSRGDVLVRARGLAGAVANVAATLDELDDRVEDLLDATPQRTKIEARSARRPKYVARSARATRRLSSALAENIQTRPMRI